MVVVESVYRDESMVQDVPLAATGTMDSWYWDAYVGHLRPEGTTIRKGCLV